MCTLESERLRLRPPRPSDIHSMTAWLSDYDVARMTSRVPHPYGESDAETFIAGGEANRFVIERKGDGLFMGMAGIHPDDDYEFGYWLGRPFWGFGYATEAAHRLVRHAVEELDQQTVPAGRVYDTPASGHV